MPLIQVCFEGLAGTLACLVPRLVAGDVASVRNLGLMRTDFPATMPHVFETVCPSTVLCECSRHFQTHYRALETLSTCGTNAANREFFAP